MWERGKGGFPEQRGIGARVRILRWMYKAPRMFTVSSFLEFWDGHSALFLWTSPMLFFLTCATKAWSCPIWHLLNPPWSAFQAMERTCTKPWLLDQVGALCFLCLHYRWSIAEKKAKMDHLSKVPMRLVWINGFDDTVEPRILQNRVWGLQNGSFAGTSSVLHFLIWNSLAKSGFSSKDINFGVISRDGNTLNVTSVQRASSNILDYLPQPVGEFYGVKRPGLLSRAWIHLD